MGNVRLWVSEMGKLRMKVNNVKAGEQVFTCEWCGMSYPSGGWLYWEVQLFNKEEENHHIICDDCKEHLKRMGL